ncbi:MAG: UDP-glucose 6-dehydrogenase [Candidatus Adiutrix intracellularis]|jgi:UDPglucose 6-dehydrogenase|nr:MAG: UDP-glucose 6-dehydrogenase [Candidatus Adiutrix intracellularis]MDR2827456.1 UDP-glucose/GDP-mannose dehydrogenase family protein [Candidatus Adiutrix intracellularis]
MKITIIGSGYVGLVTGACFAEMGNTVYCVDKDIIKIEALNQGQVPIYEPGLSEMIRNNIKAGVLHFTNSLAEALALSDLCFIAVGTPTGEDGSSDLSQVLDVAATIGRTLNRNMVIVNKSTVPVGTAIKVKNIIGQELARRGCNHNYRVLSNPEFLKEGSAITDCMSPDRVIIGTPDEAGAELMKELYSSFVRTSDRFLVMDVASAEMTKYAANAMLATRISFMNEMAEICEAVGADINKVRLGVGSDNRIGYSFLFAGCGYGGSCFPKDIKALIKTATNHGLKAGLLQEVEQINQRQKLVLVKKIIRRFGPNLSGLNFAIWGLAFKPNTDDIREAPALTIIRELLALGSRVTVYDPKALTVGAKELPPSETLRYAKSKYSALTDADALILITEWKEFRSPDFLEIKNRMKTPIILDGRNQYKTLSLKKLGFEYYQIGVSN